MNRRILTIAAITGIAAAAMLALGGCAAPTVDEPGLAPQGADASDSRLVAEGAVVYQQHCASCHGANLEGQANWRVRQPGGILLAPPHDATGHTWHHPDDLLFRITKSGTDAVIPGPYRSNMPGFSDVLDDGDIWAVLAYIKSTWPPEIREAQPVRSGG